MNRFPEELTIPEAADACGISERTIRRAIKKGSLRARFYNSRVVRIEREWLNRWRECPQVVTSLSGENEDSGSQ